MSHRKRGDQSRETSAGLLTRELSSRTWPDFVKLFKKPGEWNPCMCVYYHRPRPLPNSRWLRTRQLRAARNLREHKKLLRDGCAHGILVYSGGEPVGWCQYGTKEELPRIDAKRNYKALRLGDRGKRLWRITCFSVDRGYRHQGVASAGLSAALVSIRRKGGGLVEAYPATDAGALALWFGTVSMFENEGFKELAPFGRSNVLMTKTV